MSKGNIYTGRNTDQDSSEHQQYSSISEDHIDISTPSIRYSQKKDMVGDEMVRCRGCLKVKCQLRSLAKHVKRRHYNFYKANKTESRTFFIALKD